MQAAASLSLHTPEVRDTPSVADTPRVVNTSGGIDDSAWASLFPLSGLDSLAEAYLNVDTLTDHADTPRGHIESTIPEHLPSRSTPRGRCTRGRERLPAPQIQPIRPNSTRPSKKLLDANACKTCGKVLSSQNALRLHCKTHEGDRPWECEECGARFARKDHLRVHYRVHTGERPYTCMFCGNSFAHSGTLKSHIRTHTGEKPFGCNSCGVCFSDPSTLRMHKLKHAGVKPFICGDCGRSFASNGILNKHKRSFAKGECALKKVKDLSKELEERLFPCDVCGRLFKSVHSLNCHTRYHAKHVIRSRRDEEMDVDALEETKEPYSLDTAVKLESCEHEGRDKNSEAGVEESRALSSEVNVKIECLKCEDEIKEPSIFLKAESCECEGDDLTRKNEEQDEMEETESVSLESAIELESCEGNVETKDEEQVGIREPNLLQIKLESEYCECDENYESHEDLVDIEEQNAGYL